MSIYFVFGMTRPEARLRASKILPTNRMPHEAPETEAEKMARYARELQAEEDHIFEGTKIVRLSEGFATPEFAHDFMALARKHGARDLRIRVRKISTNALGDNLTTEKGNAQKEWQEWENQ